MPITPHLDRAVRGSGASDDADLAAALEAAAFTSCVLVSSRASFQPGAATSDADLDLLIRVTHSEHTLRARCDGYAAFYDGADAVCRGVCRAMILLARSGQTAEEKTRCLLPLRQLFRGLRRSMS